jgi:hypothetical protein
MKFQIIIQPEAEVDIEEAFQWYEEQSPVLGLAACHPFPCCLS